MAIGLLIIGDEILSGRRQDQHLPCLIALLKARGLQLDWVQIIGDQPARITEILRHSFASGDIVFSCGGIGATPDDHTRQCAAHALGLPLQLHHEAKRLIQARILELAHSEGREVDLHSAENLQRLKMGEFPEGAALVPNPFNKIPGFAMGSMYFLPGFPQMAGPMMEWILDTHYRASFHQHPQAEQALWVYQQAESALTPLMEQIEARFPQVKVFSLPSVKSASQRARIELGVKGDPEQTTAAFAMMRAALDQLQAEYSMVSAQG